MVKKSEKLDQTRHQVILVPLAVLAVFSLGFVELSAIHNRSARTTPQAASKELPPKQELPALPLIVQPEVPILNQTIETITPLPTNPSTNPYLPGGNTQALQVGPSSPAAGNVLQSVDGGLGSSKDNNLQAGRKSIRLEEARL